MPFAWWQKISKRISGKPQPNRGSQRKRVQLAVEALEDRVVPNAAPLDPSFGAGGLVRQSFQGFSNTAGAGEVILGNGQILVAGSADNNEAVARFNANGSLDTTFGHNGIATLHPGAFTSSANAITVQPDGKILLEGNDPFQTFVIRFNANGTLDNTFGSGKGYVSLSFGDIGDKGTGILAESNGTIEICGTRQLFGSQESFLARFLPTGALDNSFGTKGVVQEQVGSTSGWASLVDDGAGGVYTAGFSGNSFLLGEFNQSGQLVPAFGTNGTLTISMGANTSTHATRLARDASGNLVVVGGTTSSATGEDFAIARVSPTGQLDTTFGTNGTTEIDFSAANDEANGVAFLANGAIVVSGKANDDFGLVLLNSSGQMTNQYATDFLASNDRAAAGALDPSGRYIIAGTSHAGDTFDHMALAAYNFNVTPNPAPLDPSFGNQGLVRGTFQGFSNTAGTSEVILSNGQILVAGSADGNEAVARFNSDGSIDTTFGQNGIAIVHPGAFSSTANAIAVQPDGKILLVGNDPFSTFVIRLNTDGSLDTTFGNGAGYTSISFGDIGDAATGVLVQPNGTIEICGSRQLFGSKEGFLARLNSDGSFDTTFGTSGIVQLQVGSTSGWAALVPDGKGGVYTAGFAGNNFAFAEYDGSGNLVPTFGVNGTLTVSMGTGTTSSHATKLALDPSGNLVAVGGTTRTGTGEDFAVARVTPTGQVDTTFGTNGTKAIDFSAANDEANGIGFLADGALVISGKANDEFGVVVLNSSGQLEHQYAVDFLGSNDSAAAGILDPSGRFIVCGTSHAGDTFDHMALAAYLLQG